MKMIAKLLAGVALAAPLIPALAFPDKAVTIVTPYPAGGATDVAARLIAAKLQLQWKQPVMVENRVGASGIIGTEHVMRSPPDGYTLLMPAIGILTNELTNPAVRYRTLRDFVPITQVFNAPLVYVASNSAPGGDLRALLKAGRDPAQALDYGSHGEGWSTNFMGEQLKKQSGTPMTHIPFNGDSAIMLALLGGHLKTGFVTVTSATKAGAAGRTRMLAVAGQQRTPLLPNVPTFAEQGIPGIDRSGGTMVLAPAATPAAIVAKISQDISAIVRTEAVRAQFQSMGLEALGGTPAETLHAIQAEYAYWQNMAKTFSTAAKP